MKRAVIALLVPVLVVVSCKKDGDDNDDPQLPVTGQIAGKVWLVDEFGTPSATHDGVKIWAKTNFYDLSDAGGNFQVNNLEPGYYSLSFEKTGYGVFKKFAIPVTENATTTLTGTDTLGKISSTLVTSLSSTFEPSDSSYSFTCTLSPLPSVQYPRSFRLFFGNTGSVSPEDYIFTPVNYWTATTSSGTLTGFDPSELYNAGFISGQTVYVKAYGESMVSNVYTDPVSGKKKFPNVNVQNPSNSISFILP